MELNAWKNWQLNPASLLLGLEQELLVFDQGRPPSLNLVKAVFEYLCERGYRVAKRDQDQRPLQVNRELKTGYVAIKNDFCTNIFEFALPPVRTPAELIHDYKLIRSDLAAAFAANGLTVRSEAFIRLAPEKIVTVPGARLEWLMTRSIPQGRRFSDRLFAASIAATQLHFNILSSSLYQFLPQLYSLEYLVPLFFSNSSDRETQVRCARPHIYKDNYLPSYRALGIPEPIPTTRDEYQRLLDETVDFQRDYSFIAPRSFGTVEFRSACAQRSIDDVLELCALRIASIIAAHHRPESIHLRGADFFMDICEHGAPDPGVLAEDLSILESSSAIIPGVWVEYWQRAANRIRSQCYSGWKQSA